MQTSIKRKPVANKDQDGDGLGELELEQDEVEDLENQLDHLQLEEHSDDDVIAVCDDVAIPPTDTPDEVSGEKASKLQTALSEIKYFAGGLVKHPHEATRHHSVLRHANGIVFYQGSVTSIAITIFSDLPLPSDRQLFLQRRGFSGKTGMKIGTFGSRSAWINVTPSLAVDSMAVPSGDERAWQRDIKKFLKSAASTKNLKQHKPSETHVLRVPFMAEDGYFRVVLCAGRKVLCPSPMFRLISTSSNPGHLRGASLTTLPLELGMKVGSKVAWHSANVAAHGALQPAITAYQTAAQPYMPNTITQKAVSTAYDVTLSGKLDQKVNAVNQQYILKEEANRTKILGDEYEAAFLLSGDGPVDPYPFKFTGKPSKVDEQSTITTGATTAATTIRVVDVADEVQSRLAGVYAAWILVNGSKKRDKESAAIEKKQVWHPAVVTVSTRLDVPAKVIETKAIHACILHEFERQQLLDRKLDILLVGYLHPGIPAQSVQQQQDGLKSDISVVDTALKTSAWAVEGLLERMSSNPSKRSTLEKAADVRRRGQQQVDKVPFHKLGIRMNSQHIKDEIIGNGGFFVARS